MIKIHNLTLSYIKEYNTLMNINCELNGNTFFQGGIDDGTHSLFRVLAKLEKKYSGSVIIDDINLKDIRDKDMNLAYISQEPYLFNRDIFFNLYYPLKIRKVVKSEAKKLVNETINKYIKNFPERINKLNHSEKKIITLLRAMIRKPKYILIEDFFADLDSRYSALVNEIITEISQSSIIIACGKNIDDCYQTFKKYSLSFGSLQDIV